VRIPWWKALSQVTRRGYIPFFYNLCECGEVKHMKYPQCFACARLRLRRSCEDA
jgi:hypothetical protein